MKKADTKTILESSENTVFPVKEICIKNLHHFKNKNLKEYGVFSSSLNSKLDELEKLANTGHIPVLISGSTGSGKEVLAKYIHFEVDKNQGPYVAINCSNVNKELFEAELFGYTKGAFTGARQQGKDGYIKMAENGTLFLDEITEIDLDIQVKLLRVLQEREYYKVGGEKKNLVNCRIIGATNRDIKKMVNEGRFREDLYYRLNIIELNIPGLNKRKDEIIPLICWFISHLNKQFKKEIQFIEAKVLKLLYNYSWPGNVRELKNFITQVMIFIESDTIKFEHLKIKDELDRLQTEMSVPSEINKKEINEEWIINRLLEKQLQLEDFTFKIVKAALHKFNGNKSKAAKYLGLKREQLYNRYKLD